MTEGEPGGAMSDDLFSAAMIASRWSAGKGGWLLVEENWLLAVSGRRLTDVVDLAEDCCWGRGRSLGVANGDAAVTATAATSLECLLSGEENDWADVRSMRIWSICVAERRVWEPWSVLTELVGCFLRALPEISLRAKPVLARRSLVSTLAISRSVSPDSSLSSNTATAAPTAFGSSTGSVWMPNSDIEGMILGTDFTGSVSTECSVAIDGRG